MEISERTTNVGIARHSKLLLVLTAIGIVLMVVTLALSAATLATVRDRLPDTDNVITEASTSAPGDTTTTSNPNPTLTDSIQIADVMGHLRELQKIADESSGNRAVTKIGFNRTLNYITDTLKGNTNFKVSTTFFLVRQFELNSDPILTYSIDGVEKNYTFSEDLSEADFYYVQYSVNSNLSIVFQVTFVPDVACTDADWQAANPPPQGRAVLVKRGTCAFDDKAKLAAKYNASALLLYNDGTTPERIAPIAVSLGQENAIPALFLSYTNGKALIDALENGTSNVTVRMNIDTKDLPKSPVGNICADTPTGNVTQTIVLGSHSDSVPAGPGINDNGSGSAANLALAIALARLFERSDYEKYAYRVRFCWWGAEEIGLLGSEDHVKKAKVANEIGERLRDYLINLNYDMLGSPNFIFGIYNGSIDNAVIPDVARQGSENVRKEFQKWFNDQNLPSTLTSFDGRSDYGPFLEEGIVAGGLFSGADGTKTRAERDEYNSKLGGGLGGISGVSYDPCYHEACDSIDNIHVFGFEKLVKAAAYMLEFLGRKSDLKQYLYPNGRPTAF